MEPAVLHQDIARFSLLGLPVHCVDTDLLTSYILQAAAAGDRRTVMYLNAHVCNLAVREPALRAALEAADLVYCDGAGVKLAARMLGQGFLPRSTAADFLPTLMRECARRGLRVFLLGGRPGVAREAAAAVFPSGCGGCVVGTHHGYFSSDSGGSAEVLDAVSSARPDLVCVGMGSPRQEVWVHRHRRLIEASAVWCIGAAMDFVSGRVKRAPRWMRENGMEWLFRLLLEPRRLFTRYVVGNPLFLARVLTQRMRGAG